MSTNLVCNYEPLNFTAGDTVHWVRTLWNPYLPPDWALTYTFSGPQVFSVPTTVVNGQFSVTMTADFTANLNPGRYAVTATVAKDAERHTVPVRFKIVTILTNPAKAQGGQNITWAQSTLNSIETAIAALSARTQQSASINGQSYSLQDIEKLWRLRMRLTEEVQAEKERERLDGGLGASKNILVRFPGLWGDQGGGNPWPVIIGPVNNP